jgi:hypothetical protein
VEEDEEEEEENDEKKTREKAISVAFAELDVRSFVRSDGND